MENEQTLFLLFPHCFQECPCGMGSSVHTVKCYSTKQSTISESKLKALAEDKLNL